MELRSFYGFLGGVASWLTGRWVIGCSTPKKKNPLFLNFPFIILKRRRCNQRPQGTEKILRAILRSKLWHLTAAVAAVAAVAAAVAAVAAVAATTIKSKPINPSSSEIGINSGIHPVAPWWIITGVVICWRCRCLHFIESIRNIVRATGALDIEINPKKINNQSDAIEELLRWGGIEYSSFEQTSGLTWRIETDMVFNSRSWTRQLGSFMWHLVKQRAFTLEQCRP